MPDEPIRTDVGQALWYATIVRVALFVVVFVIVPLGVLLSCLLLAFSSSVYDWLIWRLQP